jgi:hypothetical protein
MSVNMGYFPSLDGEAKELYEKVKEHEDFQDIIRCFELDAAIEHLSQDKGERWIISHAKFLNDWKDYAKYVGRQSTRKLYEGRIVNLQLQLTGAINSLNQLYENWDKFPDSRDECEHFLKMHPNATLEEAFWAGYAAQ